MSAQNQLFEGRFSGGPLSREQAVWLQQQIVSEARRTLVARRFLGIWGPIGAGLESITVEEYGPDSDGEIELSGDHDPSPIEGAQKRLLRVPILYKDFVLHWRDVQFASQLGAPLDASRAVRAGHSVADREDQLLFNGEPRFQLEGLLNATGRNRITRSDWSVYGQAYRDIVAATELLLEHSHHRPFALAVSAKDYARLVRQREGEFAPEITSIRGLCDDGLFTSPAIPEGRSVVLSTGDQNFDIAMTQDFTLDYLSEKDHDYLFRVFECLVLRIKRPKAICTIE